MVERPPAAAAAVAFAALLARDLTVLRKQPADFLARTIVQPMLFVFVLGYIGPRIAPGGTGDGTQIATTLLAGRSRSSSSSRVCSLSRSPSSRTLATLARSTTGSSLRCPPRRSRWRRYA
jgi:hypothetical protein